MGAFDDLIPGQGGLVPLTQPDPTKLNDEAQSRTLRDIQIQKGMRELEEGPKTARKPLPESSRTKLESQVTALSNFERAINAFNPEFAGIGSGIENTAQEYISGIGTPGQRDWWSDFKATDMQLRNAMFGASLTDSEKASFAETTISPSTDPKIIAQNLKRRMEMARDILARRARSLKAGPYDPLEVEALLGEYDPDAAPVQPQRALGAGDIGFAGARAEGPAFNPQQQTAYDAFLTANPNATTEQLKAFGQSIGVEINNADELIQAAREGLGFRPAADAILKEPDISDVRGKGEIVDPFMRGVADTATLGLSDELGSVVDTVARGGTYDENLRRNRAIADYDEEENFGLRLAGQFGGGLVLPTGGASTVRQLATLGGGYGGAYGAGSADGTITDRLVGAGIGAATGAGAGAAFGLIGNHIGARGGGGNPGGGRSRAVELAEAAANQGVDLLPADVGGPFTRRLTAGAAQSPISAGSIIRGGQRTVDQAQGARDRIASGVGTAVEPADAGEAAARGAQSYITQSSAEGAKLYDQAERFAGDARIDPLFARTALDRHIAELGESPMGAPATLTGLRDRLDGDFTVAGLRNLRTQLRDEFAAQGLRGSDAERRGMQVVDELTEDIAVGLSGQGKTHAADAYREADKFWRERLKTIDETLAPIIGRDGNRSGEQVFNALQSAARADGRRLKSFMRAIPEEEQATVRATVIGQMGRSSAGRQNAEGTGFSLAEFSTHWNKLTPRAKETLFDGETRSALDDLAKVADASKQAAGYANRPNTGGVLMSGALGASVTIISPKLLAALALNYGAGRLLASPKFARWLARPPKSPGTAARRLARIAVQEPAIAADIAPIQRALEGATPFRAAAEQEND